MTWPTGGRARPATGPRPTPHRCCASTPSRALHRTRFPCPPFTVSAQDSQCNSNKLTAGITAAMLVGECPPQQPGPSTFKQACLATQMHQHPPYPRAGRPVPQRPGRSGRPRARRPRPAAAPGMPTLPAPRACRRAVPLRPAHAPRRPPRAIAALGGPLSESAVRAPCGQPWARPRLRAGAPAGRRRRRPSRLCLAAARAGAAAPGRAPSGSRRPGRDPPMPRRPLALRQPRSRLPPCRPTLRRTRHQAPRAPSGRTYACQRASALCACSQRRWRPARRRPRARQWAPPGTAPQAAQRPAPAQPRPACSRRSSCSAWAHGSRATLRRRAQQTRKTRSCLTGRRRRAAGAQRARRRPGCSRRWRSTRCGTRAPGRAGPGACRAAAAMRPCRGQGMRPCRGQDMRAAGV
jgi:hypothetical protein